MKLSSVLLATAFAAMGHAQHLERVYNRDTHESFHLKDAKTSTVVKGPIVEQKTVFTFDNPYKKLTEASAWFNLDWAAVLSGFAYWYKDEYVPGVLMDKQKAWFIYTAITSRNEDPGIMVQTSPSSYHAQIYPLATGRDFRLELTSVGFLESDKGQLSVPQPSYEGDVKLVHTVKSAKPDTVMTGDKTTINYPAKKGMDMQVYAQRHKDGYTYVAGLIRTNDPNAKLKMRGIHNVFWTRPQVGDTDGTAKLFIGRRKGPGTVSIKSTDGTTAKVIKANERGNETAKLWAHQKLVQGQWRKSADVLNFSLKYQIPSTQTALLAVPQEQMNLFREKAAEFRRKAAEDARKQRAWQKQRQQNWNNSRGGDPEIRVSMPDSKRVYAELPDGRKFNLTPSRDGWWGGNYDIPADAPEGDYTVKVYGVKANGESDEQTISYKVDRTAPNGQCLMEGDFLVVKSEAKLARVVAVFGDGKEEDMAETEAGVYKLSVGQRRVVKVVLFDQAHNHRELAWSR